jgi:acetoin utilization protein AcuC
MSTRPRYIAAEIYRKSRYGAKHPLSIPRVSTTTDLIRALGWLDDARYIEGPVATPEALVRFHDPDYVAALRRAETDGLSEPERRRWNIGVNGNPIYPEVFRRPATAAGSSILAADLVAAGGTVHSPAGGTHHGRPDRASGFCYLNDPVLGILALLDKGLAPVAYVDLDAHHGDGVEDAFAEEPRVTTISVHEAGRWPRSGVAEHDRGESVMNVPVPSGFNDDEFQYVLETAILPKLAALDPAAIVIQCGVDGLADDPLSKLALSNGAYWRAVSLLLPMAPRRIVLGGGGYNPFAVARAWAGIWGVIDGREVPDRLPEPASDVLRAITWRHGMTRAAPARWVETLADPPKLGPIREDTRDAVRRALRASR